MSKARDVLLAWKALATEALTTGGFPAVEIKGFDRAASIEIRVGAGGTALGEPGEPGEPTVDLSPLMYRYRHRLPLVLFAPSGTDDPSADVVEMAGQIGAAVKADPTLGGLCDWCEMEALEAGDDTALNAQTRHYGATALIAEYGTPDPLN